VHYQDLVVFEHLLETKIWSSEKSIYVGKLIHLASRSVLLVHQSSTDFFCRTWEKSRSIKYLSDFVPLLSTSLYRFFVNAQNTFVTADEILPKFDFFL